MRPGMSCAVEILIEELADAIYVPVQAVFRDGDDNFSFVAARGGVERRKVRVGRFTESWVHVVEGLAQGETVLMSAPAGFEEAEEPVEAEAAPGGEAKDA